MIRRLKRRARKGGRLTSSKVRVQKSTVTSLFFVETAVKSPELTLRGKRVGNYLHIPFPNLATNTIHNVAAVTEWYRYRNVVCLVTSLSPVPLTTRRVGQRCTLNLSRAETFSRWCGVVVRRGGGVCQLRCVHVT
ncbi:uncharacterized protein TNCV_646541 [Trichonephila clavipes]|nr:uncharacterized protein TNCV_646541 [Trichonephila clavipes]